MSITVVGLLVCAAFVSTVRPSQSSPNEFRGVRLLPETTVHATSSDAFADGIAAVNTRFCDRQSGYTSFTNPDDATVRHLLQGAFRHIRDGGTHCLGDRAFATFAKALYSKHGIDSLSEIGSCASDEQIRRLFVDFPGTRAVEGPNEYDESKPIQYALTSAPSGTKSIVVPADTGTTFTISQSYLFGEGPAAESLVVASCGRRSVVTGSAVRNDHPAGFTTALDQPVPAASTSFVVRDATRIRVGAWVTLDCEAHSAAREALRIASVNGDTVAVGAPMRFEHARGAAVVESCFATPNSYVSDLVLLYKRMASVLRGDPKTAAVPILADSQAAQADNSAFSGSGIDRFEDVGNLHDYPGQRNPGGADGDGTKGYGDIVADCGPYGAYWYNMCFESLQFKFSQDRRAIKPVWTTEVSYNVAPVGGPWNAAQRPIPDDVAVKYLPRLELFYLRNAHARVYWFELVDSASGCGGEFAQFGLIRRDCRGVGVETPKPEYYALADMISIFSDSGCRYPNCSFKIGSATVSVSGAAPGFQYHLFEKRDGTYLLAFWLERPNYDASSMGPCHLSLSCYITVPPATVSFSIKSSDGFQHPTLRTFETHPEASRFGHLTAPVAASISTAGTWAGAATDTVQILSWQTRAR